MKFIIVQPQANMEEAKVVESFLNWQGYACDISVNFSQVISVTNGKPCVLIYKDAEEPPIIGFKGLLSVFNSEGLFRL